MKRKCKNVDITNPGFIRGSMLEFIRSYKARKSLHKWFVRVCRRHKLIKSDKPLKVLAREAHQHILQEDDLFWAVIYLVSEAYSKELRAGDPYMEVVQYKVHIPEANGKPRNICHQSIKQHILDRVAVRGMRELNSYLGKYQCASIKGRGQLYGAKYITKWLRERGMYYFVKLDVRKCYESMKIDTVMAFLAKKINNPRLLRLIKQLLDTQEKGFGIGSHLSQFLCNLYLAQAYHFVSEQLFYERKGKRYRQVKHVLIFMDDILLLGTNKRQLKKGAERLIQFLYNSLRLEVKPWEIRDIRKGRKYEGKWIPGWIDMLGFRVDKRGLLLRRHIHKKYRRALLRVRHFLLGGNISKRVLRRLVSLHGFASHCHREPARIRPSATFWVYRAKLLLRVI